MLMEGVRRLGGPVVRRRRSSATPSRWCMTGATSSSSPPCGNAGAGSRMRRRRLSQRLRAGPRQSSAGRPILTASWASAAGTWATGRAPSPRRPGAHPCQCGHRRPWREASAEGRARRLCALPPARPPRRRRHGGGLLLFQQCRDRRRPADARRESAPPSSTSTSITAMARKRSSMTARCAHRLDPCASEALLSLLLGLCGRDRPRLQAKASTSTCRWNAAPRSSPMRRASTPHSGACGFPAGCAGARRGPRHRGRRSLQGLRHRNAGVRGHRPPDRGAGAPMLVVQEGGYPSEISASISNRC
jgi:hypothetical protein